MSALESTSILNAWRQRLRYAGRSEHGSVFFPVPSAPLSRLGRSRNRSAGVTYRFLIYLCATELDANLPKGTPKQPRGEERRGNRFSCRAKRVLCPAGKSFPLVHIHARNLIRRQFTVAVVTIGFEATVPSIPAIVRVYMYMHCTCAKSPLKPEEVRGDVAQGEGISERAKGKKLGIAGGTKVLRDGD